MPIEKMSLHAIDIYTSVCKMLSSTYYCATPSSNLITTASVCHIHIQRQVALDKGVRFGKESLNSGEYGGRLDSRKASKISRSVDPLGR